MCCPTSCSRCCPSSADIDRVVVGEGKSKALTETNVPSFSGSFPLPLSSPESEGRDADIPCGASMYSMRLGPRLLGASLRKRGQGSARCAERFVKVAPF